MVKVRPAKLGLPKIAAMSGVMMSAISAATTAPNAAPTTTATARSTTFPRRMNCLNSFSMAPPGWWIPDPAGRVPDAYDGRRGRAGRDSGRWLHRRGRRRCAAPARAGDADHPGGGGPRRRRVLVLRLHAVQG